MAWARFESVRRLERRATGLGSSTRRAQDDGQESKNKAAQTVKSGARYAGKKMLNMVRATNHAAHKLVSRELGAFVEVILAHDVVSKTDSRFDERRTPSWNEAFSLDVCHFVDSITFKVKDRVFIGPNVYFGEVIVPAERLLTGERLVLRDEIVKRRRPGFANGHLEVELQFTPVDLPVAENLPPVVPIVYFQAHNHCRVRLYQDAHQEAGSVPAVPMRTCPGVFSAGSEATRLAESTSLSLSQGGELLPESDEESVIDSGSDMSESIASSTDLAEIKHALHVMHRAQARRKLHNVKSGLKDALRHQRHGGAGVDTRSDDGSTWHESGSTSPLGGTPSPLSRTTSASGQQSAGPNHLHRLGGATKSTRQTLTGADGLSVAASPQASGAFLERLSPSYAGTASAPDNAHAGGMSLQQSPRRTELLAMQPGEPEGDATLSAIALQAKVRLAADNGGSAAGSPASDNEARTVVNGAASKPSDGSIARAADANALAESAFDCASSSLSASADGPVRGVAERFGVGDVYEAHSCWADVERAIFEAEDFIYVTGWSIYPWTKLQRPDGATLGQMLKSKADQGVVVCMLVWDDKSSINLPGVLGGFATLLGGKPEGMMATHDELTRSYFQGSRVCCEVIQRSGGKGNRIAEATVASAFFSHHQKTLVCDAPPSEGVPYRSLKAFVGGLDLTTGRFDTAKHKLFSGRDTTHKGDWCNNSAAANRPGAPRQPWHDIHCCIEGPACRDVMRNFEERWLRQVGEHRANELFAHGAGHIGGRLPAPYLGQGAGATVQILRSIDGRSALLDRGNPFPALHYKKGRPVDASILAGLVHHIRRARHFIYIENQYFMGSSFMWKHDRKFSCHHVVPAEITAKICSKIRRGERFCAYIVIPLHPEGSPTADTTQLMLRFQAHTMRAMYREIGRVIEETRKAGTSARGDPRLPQDYLLFLTLGQRDLDGHAAALEDERDEEDIGAAFEGFGRSKQRADADAAAYSQLAARQRRFMIYVHSKLMIVDDEVALVGSANINMRSLAGTRDTEIAASIFQRHHLCPDAGAAAPPLSRGAPHASLPEGLPDELASKLIDSGGATPTGVVHHFRLSLFAEHLGAYEEVFRWPASLACARRVRSLAQDNWTSYATPIEAVSSEQRRRGHAMVYPVAVLRTGRVVPMKGFEKLPDTKVDVMPEKKNKFGLPATLVT